MALDAAALALCAKELSAALADARIDKIFEPTRDEVVLNLRTRTDNPRLFLSARSGSARACLTKETFENPQTPPSFCMLLRKHFTGGRLLEVRTLPDERILFFDFQCTNEMGDIVVNTMAAELMGRYSNLVLVQTKNPANPAAEGKIIDALKRVDFEDSEVRQLLPGLAYTLPPQPQKASFLGVSAAGIVAAVSSALVLYPLFPDARDEYLLLAIVAIATVSAVLATWLTPPVPDAHLEAFTRRVHPPGWWRDLPGAAPRRAMGWLGIAWVSGNAGVFALMFGIGGLLLGSSVTGALLVLGGLVGLWGAFRGSEAFRMASAPR